MMKILQATLQQYVNRELPDVRAGFRKVRGTRDQIANLRWVIEKAREFHKSMYFCLLSTPKPLTMWITKLEVDNILKHMSCIICSMYNYLLKLIIACEFNQDHFG